MHQTRSDTKIIPRLAFRSGDFVITGLPDELGRRRES
jgi:hypothetical protein